MMDLLLATSGGEAQAAGGGYVDDVFSAYVRTGTGADVTVNTNIDMTKGYMLWTKGRSGATDHAIYDSARGVTFDLASNLTSAQTTQSTGLKSVSGTGHTIGSLEKMNTNAATYVDWVFRKAPKFFDVVTYTGNGVAGRQIAHNLGVAPGMIIVKRIDSSQEWDVYHRGTLYHDDSLWLNSTSSSAYSTGSTVFAAFPNIAPTSAEFYVGRSSGGRTNISGAQYIAYLFAHDPSAEGIIQCGSYVGNGSGNGPEINLGWEPQYLLVKNITSATGWHITDSMRGFSSGGTEQLLWANESSEEGFYSVNWATPTATGFKLENATAGSFNASGSTYIYLAIRRPNKPPTSGTQVYNAIARTGTGAAATVTGVGFAPDLVNIKSRSTASGGKFFDRLRGASYQIVTSSTGTEQTFTNTVTSIDVNGISLGSDGGTSYVNTSGDPVINHFFRRSPGFFDVVCDTGTGTAHAIAHNLTKAPELIIRKSRSAATQWEVWHSALAATEKLVLNSNAAKATDATAWGSTLPTATQFTVGTGANVNANAATFVTYLFATLAGISKVGSYTGNGSSQTIDCGFSTGARFVLIKRTDAAGDWYVWDTARGIVAANDPHLSLNTIAAEVTTDDSIDPDASGFIVNQNTATNINVNGGSYIFLAIA